MPSLVYFILASVLLEKRRHNIQTISQRICWTLFCFWTSPYPSSREGTLQSRSPSGLHLVTSTSLYLLVLDMKALVLYTQFLCAHCRTLQWPYSAPAYLNMPCLGDNSLASWFFSLLLLFIFGWFRRCILTFPTTCFRSLHSLPSSWLLSHFHGTCNVSTFSVTAQATILTRCISLSLEHGNLSFHGMDRFWMSKLVHQLGCLERKHN